MANDPRAAEMLLGSPSSAAGLGMACAQSASVLEIVDLHKSFGQLRIIRNLNLDVIRGERHALIGPNGAGKSTLFALVSGLLQPTSGRIYLDGHDITGVRPHLINRKGLGRSFQITNVFPNLTVFENVRIGMFGRQGIRFGVTRLARRADEANEAAHRLVNDVGLQDKADWPAAALSYSEQRALEIGLTLTTNPSVILLDEPTAGMSRDEAQRTIELILSVTEGRTLVMIEHDMDVVFSICDRVSVLVYGNIIATGSPSEVKANKAVQDAYLGGEAG